MEEEEQEEEEDDAEGRLSGGRAARRWASYLAMSVAFSGCLHGGFWKRF